MCPDYKEKLAVFTTKHVSDTGRTFTFEGDSLFRVTVHSRSDEATNAELAAAGLPVPTEADELDEVFVIAADRRPEDSEWGPASSAITRTGFLSAARSGLMRSYDVADLTEEERA